MSNQYVVKVNGKERQVQTCHVSAMPFNCTWPGHQRDINQTEISEFLNFTMSEPVTVKEPSVPMLI